MSGEDRRSLTELTRMAQVYEKRGRTKEAGELMELVERIQKRINKEDSRQGNSHQSS